MFLCWRDIARPKLPAPLKIWRLIPNSEKGVFILGLHKPIAHLNNMGIRQDFIVVDNICGDLDFEDGGNPVVMNRVLTGRDPVLMDAYVVQSLMHYEFRTFPMWNWQADWAWVSELEKADIRRGADTGEQLRNHVRLAELADAVESRILQRLLRISDSRRLICNTETGGLLEKLHEKSISGRDSGEKLWRTWWTLCKEVPTSSQRLVPVETSI